MWPGVYCGSVQTCITVSIHTVCGYRVYTMGYLQHQATQGFLYESAKMYPFAHVQGPEHLKRQQSVTVMGHKEITWSNTVSIDTHACPTSVRLILRSWNCCRKERRVKSRKCRTTNGFWLSRTVCQKSQRKWSKEQHVRCKGLWSACVGWEEIAALEYRVNQHWC